MTVLLEVKDLEVRRDKRLVLKSINFKVEKGQVLAIVGPNGAGKSTLLLALARLIRPTHGDIWLNGKSVKNGSGLAYRRQIGLVLQDPLLFDRSVFENIAAGLRFRGETRKVIHNRVDLWLDRLQIRHLTDRRASLLSGGEGQRVSSARALALEPALLLLDEPFSTLDPPTRNQLLDDLRQILPDNGTTSIFITHNLDEAQQLANELAIILQGTIRQIGPQEEVLRFPANEEVARFLSSSDGAIIR